MRAVFRVDSSRTIGIGHVMRCLTLAGGLRGRDVGVSFVCREHEGNLCDAIAQRGFEVHRLPAPRSSAESFVGPRHASWVGASWQTDAEQTRRALESRTGSVQWLIVDHYGLDERWERALRTSTSSIMAIDDLADRAHDCDLLLDQNLVPHAQDRYAGRVPRACNMLLGPEFALLQPEYVRIRQQVATRSGPVRRIFAFFGGADRDDLTGRALSAFLQLDRPDIELDLVTVGSPERQQELLDRARGHSNVHLYQDLPTLAPLLAKADLAIGAGGATSWERLCLGVPSMIITLAANQRPVAEGLSQAGLAHWLGDSDTVDVPTMRDALARIVERGLDERWSRDCLARVDGKGVDRVCVALTLSASTPLVVRAAEPHDEALLLQWANDAVTRANSFSSGKISAESHREWFRARLTDVAGCRLYIIETREGVAVGQVRFDRIDEVWQIDYSVSPYLRGRGCGAPLLKMALSRLAEEQPQALVCGRVKAGNLPSRRVFESLGFQAQETANGVVEYRSLAQSAH